jgi:hypothetical protein
MESILSTLGITLGTRGAVANGISVNNIIGFYQDSAGGGHGFLAAVPKPATFVLAGIGLLSLLTCVRQRRTCQYDGHSA